jgi:hypothetical protein
MDAVLKREPLEPPADLLARLNRRLPSGLRVERWDALPLYASALADLAVLSRWRWEVPGEHLVLAKSRIELFLRSASWPWHRGPGKAEEALDLRRHLSDLAWEGEALVFATRMGPFQALNPLKALGAILGLEPAQIRGLTRIGVDLQADVRLAEGERYAPKLKNMYEDAVLLGSGSNITLVDEEDDEPIRLG